jgi:hypothetical protein
MGVRVTIQYCDEELLLGLGVHPTYEEPADVFGFQSCVLVACLDLEQLIFCDASVSPLCGLHETDTVEVAVGVYTKFKAVGSSPHPRAPFV